MRRLRTEFNFKAHQSCDLLDLQDDSRRLDGLMIDWEGGGIWQIVQCQLVDYHNNADCCKEGGGEGDAHMCLISVWHPR